MAEVHENKWDRSARSLKVLQDHGIPYDTFNKGLHIVLKVVGNEIHYWPTTGTWRNMTTKDRGRYIESIMEHIEDLKIDDLFDRSGQ